MSIDLPISKSIANRILMLQAVHGDPLMEVNEHMPDDVRLLHDTLLLIQQEKQKNKSLIDQLPVTYHLGNCGTAMRFLTAYCATQKGQCVILDGSERLRKRPIEQLVDCLHDRGALIQYMDEEGCLPLYIFGTKLNKRSYPVQLDNPASSQMVSALMLVGVPVTTNSRSPYITMTKSLIDSYHLSPVTCLPIEPDWSAAAFWYEYVALHGGEIELKGLKRDSIQGDKVVAKLFKALGVDTLYTNTGVRISRTRVANLWPKVVNFTNCPDLYPAVALTYHMLGKPLIACGTESLSLKESNRIEAVETLTSRHDHRISMALLAADLPTDDTDCIRKSYPHFVEQLNQLKAQCTIDYTTIIPRRGINDDNLGKKHALHKLITVASTPYVWLQDDDIIQPSRLLASSPSRHLNLPKADLYILPLRMQGGDSLLERLQKAEYAAIQQVTMQTAKRGRAVLCSGANMLVNREEWLNSWPDLHTEIPSGDDMFLLESFRRRGLTILPVDQEEFTATVSAQTTWSAFFRQRMRWAGKAPHYTDRYIRRYAAMILLANLVQLICPLVMLIKFPIEYNLIKKRDPEVSFGVAIILEIMYPLYILFCILGGLLRRNW